MALPISKVVTKTTNIGREVYGISKDLQELDFASFEGQKFQEKKESPQKEKQIPVDQISLRESQSSIREISFNMMLPPINAPQGDLAVPHPLLPPPFIPAKQKFLSCSYSLHKSTASSPRFGSILSRKNMKNENQASPRQFDKLVDDDAWHHDHGSLISSPNVNNDCFRKSIKKMDGNEVDFKCGALCMFLPGFSKAKPVRPRMTEEAMAMEDNVISRTVSMEKFECRSRASSTMIQDHDEDYGGDSMNLYFDLPLELIKDLSNDAELPVSAAFVFDNKDMKGVLKIGSTPTGAAAGRKSHESSRHVMFSTSSSPPSYPDSLAACITPREDSNAFLEVQNV